MPNAALLQSVATTLADYRAGEIPQPDAAHVERWVRQFDPAVHDDVLVEMDHILKQTYLSRANMTRWLARLVQNPALTAGDARSFWRTAELLRTQDAGKSQTLLNAELDAAVYANLGVRIGSTGSMHYVYVDDGLFSGRTLINELTAWITNLGLAKTSLDVIVTAAHRLGCWHATGKIAEVAAAANKQITVRVWQSVLFEDRVSYIDASEVLRPSAIPNDQAVADYVATNLTGKWAPRLRTPGAMPASGLFYSSRTRDILESEFLKAGAMIRARCGNVGVSLRPLGFWTLPTLGFGTLFVSYRNCPNNAPLPMWWGDPDSPVDALNCWYPLVPRRARVTTPAFFTAVQRLANRPAPPAPAAAPAVVSADDDGDDRYEGADSPWEAEADKALAYELDQLAFDVEAGEVSVPHERGAYTFESREALEQHLAEVYDEAWYANAPFEGGVAVFDSDSAWAVTEALEDRYGEELAALGW